MCCGILATESGECPTYPWVEAQPGWSPSSWEKLFFPLCQDALEQLNIIWDGFLALDGIYMG